MHTILALTLASLFLTLFAAAALLAWVCGELRDVDEIPSQFD